MAHNELITLFIWLSLIVDVFNTPRNNCNLAPHIIQVVLRFNRVPGLAEYTDQRISNDSVSDMTNMQRTIRVGTGVFKNNPFGSCRKLAVIRMPSSTNGCGYIVPSKDEVDIGTLSRNLKTRGSRMLNNLGNNLRCNYAWILPFFFCQGKCNR